MAGIQQAAVLGNQQVAGPGNQQAAVAGNQPVAAPGIQQVAVPGNQPVVGPGIQLDNQVAGIGSPVVETGNYSSVVGSCCWGKEVDNLSAPEGRKKFQYNVKSTCTINNSSHNMIFNQLIHFTSTR